MKSTSLLPAGVLIEEPELTEALKASGIDITSECLFNYVPVLLLPQHPSLHCSHYTKIKLDNFSKTSDYYENI